MANEQSNLEAELDQARATNRELHRRVQSLEHALAQESGRNSWYGYYVAVMKLWKEEMTTVEAARSETVREIVGKLRREADRLAHRY